jgi:hypothetical protein
MELREFLLSMLTSCLSTRCLYALVEDVGFRRFLQTKSFARTYLFTVKITQHTLAMVMSSCSSSGSFSRGNPCTFTSKSLLRFKVAPISLLPYTISFAVLMLGKHLRTLSVCLLPTDRQSPINQLISLIVVVNTAN